MKIRVENLGVLRKAEFELGDLTIICGENNTGKTYATYALYGFLKGWNHNLKIQISRNQVNQLIDTGAMRIDIVAQAQNIKSILEEGFRQYKLALPRVFASKEAYFKGSTFEIEIPTESVLQNAKKAEISVKWQIGAKTNETLSLTKDKGEQNIVVSLLVDTKKIEAPPVNLIKDLISEEVIESLFGSIFPRPFIASAERTGAAIFRKELNFARNRLLEEMSKKDRETDPMELLFKSYQDYALPVKNNVDFIRDLETIAKEESYLLKKHPKILKKFADIIGGEYIVGSNDTLYFKPEKKSVRLTMDESSSAVRSLLDIGFYLHHEAKPGDLLMVDEPELNLHPENQRRVARLLARLVNLGIKVFITTHSDYIIKELNTLIMLNNDAPNLKQIAKKEGYENSELIDANKVKMYTAKKALVHLSGNQRKSKHHTLEAADINQEEGIEACSFDKTINKMNEIQNAILWGGD